MITKKEALNILKREYNYEDELSNDLTITYLANLKNIEGLSSIELKKLKKGLSIIRDESLKHKEIFADLVKFVKDKNANF